MVCAQARSERAQPWDVAGHRVCMGYCSGVGAWRSLVARTVRVGEVPSSNLGAPIKSPANAGFFVGRILRWVLAVRPFIWQ
jgi:hypothetical protein